MEKHGRQSKLAEAKSLFMTICSAYFRFSWYFSLLFSFFFSFSRRFVIYLCSVCLGADRVTKALHTDLFHTQQLMHTPQLGYLDLQSWFGIRNPFAKLHAELLFRIFNRWLKFSSFEWRISNFVSAHLYFGKFISLFSRLCSITDFLLDLYFLSLWSIKIYNYMISFTHPLKEHLIIPQLSHFPSPLYSPAFQWWNSVTQFRKTRSELFRIVSRKKFDSTLKNGSTSMEWKNRQKSQNLFLVNHTFFDIE